MFRFCPVSGCGFFFVCLWKLWEVDRSAISMIQFSSIDWVNKNLRFSSSGDVLWQFLPILVYLQKFYFVVNEPSLAHA